MISAQARKDLAKEALAKAFEVRIEYGLRDEEPLSIYELCRETNITVRFLDATSPEGMYIPGVNPKIVITSQRPAARRVFTAAHELGHHHFRHGKKVDLLIQQSHDAAYDPDEFLADRFAGFLLMPSLGIQHAFVKRGWNIDSPTSTQMFIVACEYGVGYTTLVAHCRFGINLLGNAQYENLKKVSLPQIRKLFLGAGFEKERLIVVDGHSGAPIIEAEEGDLIILPEGCVVPGDIVIKEGSEGNLFRAARRGIITSQLTDGSIFKIIKVAEYRWQGLDIYRHGVS